MQEARVFQSLIGDLFEAICSPDSLAFRLYAAAIIDRSKRDDILDYEQSSKKKRTLLRAVEDKIQLQPSVYYEFVKILSNDVSMDFICQKMREQCGKNQLPGTFVLHVHVLTCQTDHVRSDIVSM